MCNFSAFLKFACIYLSINVFTFGKTVDALILPYKEIVISSPVKGLVAKFLVREGALVKEDDLLVQLNAEVEQLEVERTGKVWERKNFDHEGTAKLFAENMTSAEEALEKKIEADVALLEHRKARSELELKFIRAPMNGIIVRQHREDGEWVEQGQPIFDMVNIEKVYAQLLLTPEEAFPLRVGQTLSIELPELKTLTAFSGEIDFISPVVDASSNLIRVKVIIDNPDGTIRAGLRGKALLP